MTAAEAIDTLTNAFQDSLGEARRAHEAGSRVVAMSWPAVPLESIRAAGFRPLVLREDTRPTPLADTRLEEGVFSPRIRRLVDVALAGGLAFVHELVIPRTSDEDYKAFLYLRSLNGDLPPLRLFDLLQSDSPLTRDYARERTRALFAALESAAGAGLGQDALRMEIARANAARAAARRLLALRRGAPRVSGATVFPLIGAFWHMEPDAYARCASAVSDALSANPPLAGPRILIAGAAMDTPYLHREIERHGAVVVGEASPWGSSVAGADVPETDDPLAALADKYRTDSWSTRVPVAKGQSSFSGALDEGIDGVVFWLPSDDSVFGWDYPAKCRELDRRGVPHILLTCDEGEAPAVNGGQGLKPRPSILAFVRDAVLRRAGSAHV